VTAAAFAHAVQQEAVQWAFIQWVVIIDSTDYAVKLRLHVDAECFVQVYANVQKGLFSFTLVLNRARIYGRDCEGGVWHRHPRHAPDTHDFSAEGSQAVTLAHFLAEVQQILQVEGML
jgi:hypothetical protein